MDPFKNTPHTVAHSGKPLPLFDPTLLLSPKSAKASSATQAAAPVATRGVSAPAPQFMFASTDGSYPDGSSEATSAPSQGSMLERMHKVEERTQRAPKRVKRSESPSIWASKPSRGGTGIISSHIKEMQKTHGTPKTLSPSAVSMIKDEIKSSLSTAADDAQSDTISVAENVLDLTDETKNVEMLDLTGEPEQGERSFYTVNGRKVYFDSKDPKEREVCYGRIEGARIICFHVPDPAKIISARSEWPPMAVKFQRGVASNFIIKAIDPAGKDFGNLDPRTSYALKQFLDGPFRVRMEAKTDIRTKKHFEAPGQPCSDHIVVHINLFGPYKFAVDPIGKSLSQKQVWLRNPKTISQNVEIYNPHTHDHQLSRMAQKAAQKNMSNISSSGNPNFRSRTIEEAQTEVQNLFDDLEKNKDLPMIDPDMNIESELLDHQKQALAWMSQREQPIQYVPGELQTGSLWKCSIRNGQNFYHNVVTGHQTTEPPRDCLGGILADMMGLGKTLSVLALLSYTRNDAQAFELQAPVISHPSKYFPLRNMKSTLLVCPVSVITNWEDQILQHVRKDGLSFYSYHGSSRRKSLEFLSKYDVIITSYNIVKTEIYPSNRSNRDGQETPLASANFFRVVLDEAHTIRTQATQQFNACNEINASRRWALTATPVQNRLDDVGALIRFLHLSPFDQQGVFNQYILLPFKIADPEAIKRLRILISSVTLRRQKTVIDLQPRKDETVLLKFSVEEQQLYNFFAADASRRLDDISSDMRAGIKTKFGGKSYMNILRSILCLRQIAAHGKDMLRDEDMQLIEGRSSSSAISVEEEDSRPALVDHQAYSVFEILKETNQTTCAKCTKVISTELPDLPEGEDETLCTMLPCYQLVCNECTKDFKKLAKSLLDKGEERMTCPFCEMCWRIMLFEITVNGIAKAEQRREGLRKEPRKAKMLYRYSGPSTKTTMLISRLHDAAVESITLMEKGEMPIKSVVFSAWTTHLDLISIALEKEDIKFTKMVGSMNRKQRRRSIEEFTTSETCNVLLVTIGTGGVGLNLTAANKVYLMDIGFNPMAEQQAIDRVHRIGQKREVTFTRFLIEGSMEEKILELQKKKMDLADLSMQRGKVDKAEAVRAKLEQLRALFK